MKSILLLALLTAACERNLTPQQRREKMTQYCMNRGNSNAIDCAQAAVIAIPEGTK